MPKEKLSPTNCDINQLTYYAIYIAKCYHFNLNEDEIIDAATIGYVKAVNKFDPNKGSFSTILFYSIYGELSHLLKKKKLLNIRFKQCRDINVYSAPSYNEDISIIELHDLINSIKNEKEKLIIVLYYIEHKTQKEIGRILRIDHRKISIVIQQFQKMHGGYCTKMYTALKSKKIA